MRLEAERTPECEATPELIRKLVHDASARGEFMILMDDEDDERFVQIACDYDDVGGRDDGCFDLELRNGSAADLQHCTRRVTAEEAEQVFLDELDGDTTWRRDFSWEDPYVSSKQKFRAQKVGRLLAGLGILLVMIWQGAKLVTRGMEDISDVLPLVFVAILGIGFLSPFLRRGIACVRRLRTDAVEPLPPEGVRLFRRWPKNIIGEIAFALIWNGGAWAGVIFGALPSLREKGFTFDIIGFMVFPLVGSVLFVLLARMVLDHLRPHYEIRLVGNMPDAAGMVSLDYRLTGSAEDVTEVEFGLWTRRRPRGLFTSTGEERAYTTWWTLSRPSEILAGTRTHRLPRIEPECTDEISYSLEVTVYFRDKCYSSSYPLPL